MSLGFGGMAGAWALGWQAHLFDDRMASRLANPLLQAPTNWLVPIILVDSVFMCSRGSCTAYVTEYVNNAQTKRV